MGGVQECTITVGGTGFGLLGNCTVFDRYDDAITLPDGTRRGDSSCPVGAILASGDTVGWASDYHDQGSVGQEEHSWDNSCAAKGTCGLPWSETGLGGGWQICFA